MDQMINNKLIFKRRTNRLEQYRCFIVCVNFFRWILWTLNKRYLYIPNSKRIALYLNFFLHLEYEIIIITELKSNSGSVHNSWNGFNNPTIFRQMKFKFPTSAPFVCQHLKLQQGNTWAKHLQMTSIFKCQSNWQYQKLKKKKNIYYLVLFGWAEINSQSVFKVPSEVRNKCLRLQHLVSLQEGWSTPKTR